MIIQVGTSILFLAAVTLPVWAAIRLAIHTSKGRENQPLSIARESLLAAFLLYLICLAAVTIMPLPISRFRSPSAEALNLIPVLHSVKCLAKKETGVPESVKFCLENILGNVALFFPLGVLLPSVGNRFNAFQKIFAVAVCGSLGIEVTQLISRQMEIYRTVDIDDVLLNTIGAILGYICYAVVRHYANAET